SCEGLVPGRRGGAEWWSVRRPVTVLWWISGVVHHSASEAPYWNDSRGSGRRLGAGRGPRGVRPRSLITPWGCLGYAGTRWGTVAGVVFYQLVEFGADFVGVGAAAEFLEDRQGLLPGITGGGPVAGGEMDVAEIGERPAFGRAVADLAPP